MKKVEIKGKKVYLDGKEQILFGGEFQYFRIPKTTWESSLKYFKEAGINMLSFYIPWIWHEFEEGQFDFTGITLPERDLSYFLKLCEQYDFNVMVRPGPYIYAEYQGFGVPEWLREKHPEILIHYEDGQKSHEISLNHPVFLEYVKKWFEAILVPLNPYLRNNMICAWQLDNETGLPQFGYVPFMSDTNPDTIEKFRKYSQEKLKTVEVLNRCLKSDYKSFEELEPPRKGKGNKYHIRLYGEFIEDYIVDFLAVLKKMVEDLGVDTFFYLNDPYLCQWPHHSVKKAKVAPIGYDNYPKFSTDSSTHDTPFSISYATEFYHAINKDGPTIGAEVGCGWFDPRVTVAPETTLQISMVSLVRNTTILAYYLLQDCLEHDGYEWIFQSPLDVKGNPTPRYEVLKQVGAFVEKYGNLLCQTEEVYSPIGLGVYIPHVRDMIRSNLNIWSVREDLNKALLHFGGLTSMMGVLLECGYNPRVGDLESMTYEELKQLKVLFFYSTGHLDKETYDKILKFVYEGGVLVTIGYPITEDDFGDKIEKNILFPAEPYSSSNYTDFGTTNILSQASYDIVSYQVSRSQIKHKQSLHTIDMMQPMAEIVKYIGKVGSWIDTERGNKLWISKFVSTWKAGSGIHPVLRYYDLPVGYSVRHGHGKSIFIGTLLGIFYDSPAFYTKDPKKKESIITYVSTILLEAGLKPLHNPISHIEVVIRKASAGMLVFLINRGNERDFQLELDFDFYERLELIFTGKDSSLNPGYFHEHRCLKGHIDKDDVMGIYIY
jgi:hypothetical protein